MIRETAQVYHSPVHTVQMIFLSSKTLLVETVCVLGLGATETFSK